MRLLAGICLSAALYTFAVPPWGVDLMAPVVLTPFLVAVRGRSLRVGFGAGLLLAVVSSAGVGWWVVPMLARFFGLAAPVAMIAAVAMYLLGVGLPFGVFGAGAAALLRGSRPAAYLGIPALWVAGELARTYLFTGLPWEFLGHALHRRVTLIQIADATGAYGLSFLCAVTALLVADLSWVLRSPPAGGRHRWSAGALVPLGVVAGLWCVAGLYGRNRLAEWSAPSETMRVVAVQANRQPSRESSPMARAQTAQAYLRLTRSRLDGYRPELIVWPENTVGFYLDQDPVPLAALRRLSEDTGAELVVGGPRLDRSGAPHNAAYAVTSSGIAGTYDKIRLVPFAEYAPLGADLVGQADMFMPGTRSLPLPHPRGPLGVLICYEILYPNLVRGVVRAGARLLVNISNDAWLDPTGRQAAPQHFSAAVFRAVEARRSLVRATTTGISGVIAPTGVPLSVLPAGRAGIVRAEVDLHDRMSPYVRAGDVFAWLCVALAAGALAMRWGRGR